MLLISGILARAYWNTGLGYMRDTEVNVIVLSMSHNERDES